VAAAPSGPTDMRRGLAFVGVFVALAVAIVAGREYFFRHPPAPREARQATFVGRDRCAGCHAAQAALFAGSHHDLAMQEATGETVLGDFDDASFTGGGVTSTFHRRDGGFFVRTEGPDGAPDGAPEGAPDGMPGGAPDGMPDGAPSEYEVAYTFGAIPLQQYLVTFPDGRYQPLRVAWDSRPAAAGGQRWFQLHPDFDIEPDHPLHWSRPWQSWNAACAECHSTGLRKGLDPERRSYATTWEEIDVSCEACHGPGSEHLRIATGLGDGESAPVAGLGDAESAPADWGVLANAGDPGRRWELGPGATTAARSEPRATDGEIESCAHCHARRTTLAEGRTADQPLLNTHLPSLLRDDLYHADGQILDEVYVYGSFLQSRMYLSGVTCSDCHEPHGLGLRAEGNALCARCHLASRYDDASHHFHAPTSPGARCAECHMPATTYMEVDPRRDHSLRIPRPELSRSIGVPNACNACHADRPAAWAASAVERWYGPPDDAATDFARAIHAGREGAPGAAAALAAVAENAAQAPIVRATALSLLAGHRSPAARDAVRRGLADREPLVRLGALEALEGRPAAELLQLASPLAGDPTLAVRTRAGRLLASVPRSALTAAQAAAVDRAIGEYEAALRVDADQPSSQVALGNLFAATGRAAEAESAYRSALALDPSHLAAHLNLADLLRAVGSTEREADVLRRALSLRPDAPELHHALGLHRVRAGDLAGALASLQRAARLAPENPRFSYVYAVALVSAGRIELALGELEAALERHPYDRDLLTALATYQRDRGDVDAATAYAERLVELFPEDAELRRLLAQLRAARR